MKKTLAIALLAATPVFAGTSAKSPVPAPAPEPCLFTWFVGGSVGYLTEFEEAMYTLHIGTDTCWNVAGWDVALFAEIGYTEKDTRGFDPTLTAPTLTDVDIEIIPITANIKFERALSGNLGAYFGAGLGFSRVDFSVSSGSDSDWVFTAQVFAGLVYNVNQNFEVFGGARWIYFDDADLTIGGASGTLEMDDDFLLEVGVRYNF
jgi:opacity protein-like surface antigen